MNSPSEKLAALIAERLVREKLLTRTEAKKLVSKLAEGKVYADDWRAAAQRAHETNNLRFPRRD